MNRTKLTQGRLLAERPAPQDGRERVRPRSGPRRKRARSVTVNLVESPLGWLLIRGHVSDRQFAAGEQLRRDWERSGLAPRVTTCWDAPPLGKAARAAPRPLDPTASQLAAKRRFDRAVAKVGRGLDEILWRVVCGGEGMGEAERALGWPARAGKLVLGLALDRLADHYRLR